jgi:predicted CxxxxCH...CXXCH cytochrome family protein
MRIPNSQHFILICVQERDHWFARSIWFDCLALHLKRPAADGRAFWGVKIDIFDGKRKGKNEKEKYVILFWSILSIARLWIILYSLNQDIDQISVLIVGPLGRNNVQGRAISTLTIHASIFSRYLQRSSIVVNDWCDPESESGDLLLYCLAWQQHSHCHYNPQRKCLCLTMLLSFVCVTAEFDQVSPCSTMYCHSDGHWNDVWRQTGIFSLSSSVIGNSLWIKTAELICQLDNCHLKRHHGFTLSNSSWNLVLREWAQRCNLWLFIAKSLNEGIEFFTWANMRIIRTSFVTRLSNVMTANSANYCADKIGNIPIWLACFAHNRPRDNMVASKTFYSFIRYQ